MAVHNVLASVGVFEGVVIGGYLAAHLPPDALTWLAFY
jgi:hypothetical protein